MANRKKHVNQPDIVRYFGERLRALRASRGLTQRELAQAAEITVTYVSKLEAGGAAPGIDLLERLARALQVATIDLLPPRTDKSPEEKREDVRRLLDGVLAIAGPDTVNVLAELLARLAESSAVPR